MWNVDSEKLIVVRDVIVDEINFLKSRPIAESEGIYPEKSQNESDNSVSQTDFSGLNKSDKNKSDVFNKSDSNKSDNTMVTDTEESPNKIQKLHTNDFPSNKNNDNEQMSSSVRRSERLKHLPPIHYNKNNISENYIMCAQSINFKIPNLFSEINGREDK